MNCDRIAPWYAWMERGVFGRALDRCRDHFLNELQDARKALVIGDGDGRFLSALLRVNPVVRVDCVDVSGGMLIAARARAGAERVRYVQADALRDDWPGDGYDLVVTHFVLDCFDAVEQRQLAERVPQARWVVSEFRETGWGSRMLIAVMYRFFRAATGLETRHLANHRFALEAAGFRLEKCAAFRGGLLAAELWFPRG